MGFRAFLTPDEGGGLVVAGVPFPVPIHAPRKPGKKRRKKRQKSLTSGLIYCIFFSMTNYIALELALARLGMIAPAKYAFTGLFVGDFCAVLPMAA